MGLFVNSAGIWKEPAPSANDAGTWKTPQKIFVNDAGTWKEVWANSVSVTTYVGKASSATLAYNVPALAGDLAIVFGFYVNYGSYVSLPAISGFTDIVNYQYNTGNFYYSMRIQAGLYAGSQISLGTIHHQLFRRPTGIISNISYYDRDIRPISSNYTSTIVTSGLSMADKCAVCWAAQVSRGYGAGISDLGGLQSLYSGSDSSAYWPYNKGSSPVDHAVVFASGSYTSVISTGAITLT